MHFEIVIVSSKSLQSKIQTMSHWITILFMF